MSNNLHYKPPTDSGACACLDTRGLAALAQTSTRAQTNPTEP